MRDLVLVCGLTAEYKPSCASFLSSLVLRNDLKLEWTKHILLRDTFLLFDLVFFCLATFLCLIFHLLFSLNFLPPAFSFDLHFLLKLLFTFTALSSSSPHLYSPTPHRTPACSGFFFPIALFLYYILLGFFRPHSSILSFVRLCLLTCLSAAEGRLSICHRRLHGGPVKQVQEVRAHVNTSLRKERERTCLLGTGMPVFLSREMHHSELFWSVSLVAEREEVRERRCKGRGEEMCVHEAQLCLLNWIW